VKVFLSWSGDLSRRIATALAEWLPPVINAVEPFISSEIEKGAQWAAELSGQLQGSSAGIICLTPDNLDSPWLNYEAGALSKSVTPDDETNAPARVWTYLFRLRAADVRYPLAQFQHTEATREDTFRLLRGINATVSRSGERALTEGQLAKAYERWWPVLDEELKALLRPGAIEATRTPVRSTEEMLAEILELLRAQQNTALELGGSPVKFYLEGEVDQMREMVHEIRLWPEIILASLDRDADGDFLALLVDEDTHAKRFEERLRSRAGRSRLVIKRITPY
jgi:hypothetical protein